MNIYTMSTSDMEDFFTDEQIKEIHEHFNEISDYLLDAEEKINNARENFYKKNGCYPEWLEPNERTKFFWEHGYYPEETEAIDKLIQERMIKMNKYETIFIVKTNITTEEIKNTINKFTDLIKEHAQLDKVEEWGNKKLAYPIKKHTEGYYVLIYFSSNIEFIELLETKYQQDENILKFITVRTEQEEE